VLDLDYAEDSEAETDMNVVMNDAGAFIEIQGTAEGHAFRIEELQAMLEHWRAAGSTSFLSKQRDALGLAGLSRFRPKHERECARSCWRPVIPARCANLAPF
jgi:hypothetical protein